MNVFDSYGLLEPGTVRIETVEWLRFVVKSDVEIGQLVWDFENEIFVLTLVEGYFEPNVTTNFDLDEDLNEAFRMAKEVIEEIDDPSLRTDAFGNIH